MRPESERETRRLWIVSPVFNDVPSFRKLRERVGEVLAENHLTDRYSPHFVILDDSAGLDPEIASVREQDDVTVIEPPFNLGHQRAIVFAVRVIAADVDDEDSIVTMDADGEDRPEDIPRLLAALEEAPDANRRIVLALRTKRSETRTFKVFYLLFRTAFRLLTGMVVRWGNFAAFRGSVARRLFDHPQLNLCYSSTLALLDVERTLVPCARGSRYAGESRMTYSKLFLHGLSMLMPFTDRIAIRALVTFSATMVLSIGAAVVVAAIRLFTNEAIPGWATSTLLALIILSFLALGNIVVLFAVFVQSRSMSLSNLEKGHAPAARSAPAPPA